MEEIVKMLGPWPIMQFMFGITVLGFGVFMIVKGTLRREDPFRLEDKRAEWEAFQHLHNIDANLAELVKLQSLTLEQFKALAAALWNRGV